MELHLPLPADLTRSTSAQSAGRSGTTLADLRSRESIGDSFETYLKRARSDADAAPAEDVEEPQDVESRTEGDCPSSDSSEAQDPGDGAQKASGTEEVVVVQPVNVLETNTPSVQVSSSQASELPVEGRGEAAPVASDATSQASGDSQAKQAVSTPEENLAADQIEKAAVRAEASAKEAHRGVVITEPTDREAKPQVHEQAAKTLATPVSKENAPDAGKSSEKPSTNAPVSNAKQRDGQGAQPMVKSDGDSAGAKEGETRSESQSKEVRSDKPAERDSFFDLKVKDSIDRRREGSAGERGGEPADANADRAAKAHAGSDSSTSKVGARYLSALREMQPAPAERVSSENGATSVARFLISGLSEAQGASGSEMSQGVTARIVGGSGSEAVSATSGASAGGGVGQGSAAGQLFTATLTDVEAVDEMARVLRAGNGAGRQHITLKLDPPELGQLRLQVQMRQDAMTLHVEAETQSVARMLESKLSVLKESLATHGIRVERAEIVVKTPDSAETGQQRSDGEHPQSGDRGQGPAADFGGSSRQGGRAASGQQEGPEGNGSLGDYQAEPSGDVEPALGDSWTMPDGRPAAELSVDLVA